jgi:hypothetical protein
MSVYVEEWMRADGLDPLHYLTDPRHGAVRINVGELRQLGFQVGWDPDDGPPHHGAVWSIGNGSKRKKRVHKIATTVKTVEAEDATTLETVPVYNVGWTVSLFDMYLLENGTSRTSIGSRRTLLQCRDAFAFYMIVA